MCGVINIIEAMCVRYSLRRTQGHGKNIAWLANKHVRCLLASHASAALPDFAAIRTLSHHRRIGLALERFAKGRQIR